MFRPVMMFFLGKHSGALQRVPQGYYIAEKSTSRASKTLARGCRSKTAWAVRLAVIFTLLIGWTAASARVARASGTLWFSLTSVSFGNVTVGTSKSIGVVIKNAGTASVSITKESLVANMYSVSGITIPGSLAPGASLTLAIKFSPTSAITSTGYIQIGSTATNALVNISVSGTGVVNTSITSSTLTATPASLGFGTVPVGTTVSQVVQFKNTGTSGISVTAGTVTGTGFKMTSYGYPFTLSAGQTLNTAVSFTPTSTSTVPGSVTLTSNASDKTLSVALSGTGSGATRYLTASTASLNFGNVTVGKTEILPVTLKNTGTTSLTVSSVTVSGANVTTSSGVSGATIAAGQSATLDVSFSPSQVETVSGKVVISSNAADSTLTIAVAAVGVAATHSVTLSWNPSTSSGVSGYYLYRALSPSTTFSRISSTPISGTQFADTSVVAGDTYEYEVSAVSSTGVEGAKSSPVTAVVP